MAQCTRNKIAQREPVALRLLRYYRRFASRGDLDPRVKES